MKYAYKITVIKITTKYSEPNSLKNITPINRNSIIVGIVFKTAKRIKRREWIEDYFLQGCAYANAHNVMFSTNIKQVVILMIDRDLIFKEFTVNGHEFDFFTNKWKQKIIQFNRNV